MSAVSIIPWTPETYKPGQAMSSGDLIRLRRMQTATLVAPKNNQLTTSGFRTSNIPTVTKAACNSAVGSYCNNLTYQQLVSAWNNFLLTTQSNTGQLSPLISSASITLIENTLSVIISAPVNLQTITGFSIIPFTQSGAGATFQLPLA